MNKNKLFLLKHKKILICYQKSIKTIKFKKLLYHKNYKKIKLKIKNHFMMINKMTTYKIKKVLKIINSKTNSHLVFRINKIKNILISSEMKNNKNLTRIEQM